MVRLLLALVLVGQVAPPPTLTVKTTVTKRGYSATLKWEHLAGAKATVYRDGQPISNMENTGDFIDTRDQKPALTLYKVCVTLSTDCTPTVSATW